MRRAFSWFAFMCISLLLFFASAQKQNLAGAKPSDRVRKMRELDWDTYVDKVQGAWMGKMRPSGSTLPTGRSRRCA
jgi:hypothetical protein